ncbi:MAG: 1-acyl-sn-glycerol-3-phosphate acyltransferase [Clostridiales bacterium]|jgi:1-acyl-sn-glycerol-3-phosphate acyltransferase|nr:1-acyl-sn-glycerol-3-phosphate acyltransferase [Clostridiales bacterium]
MIYSIAKNVVFFLLNIVYAVDVVGYDNFPQNGSAIICANHKSFADPLVIAINLKRRLHFIAKAEIFKGKFLTWFFRSIGCIPVDRSNVAMDSFKESMKHLKAGAIIVIFAQATRRKAVDEKDAKAGVALFSVKSGAPVVPVGIEGDYKLFSRITINIGEPLDFSEYKEKRIRTPELNSITEEIMKRVKVLAGE